MSSSPLPGTPYDHVPYPCHAHRQTHPANLGAIARMRGLKAADPSRCRVLEIGCGSGDNLLPMAAHLPASVFLGVDLARTSIEKARRTAEEWGISNVTWLAGDLTGLNAAEHGLWDYIIAHGVFSWIPEEARRELLRVCGELLTEQGVAFISYNAFPGGHVRQMIRGMLLYHVDGAENPASKIRQGQALLGLLADGHRETDEYGEMLRSEAKRAMAFDPHHFYHDDLAEINQPFYVHQFAEMAGRHGLDYVWDADFAAESDNHLPGEIRTVLAELDGDPVRKAQYLDFIKCRRFRQTLLCRTRAERLPAESIDYLKTLHFSCSASGKDSKEGDGEEEEFRGESTLVVRTANTAAKKLVRAMAAVWPGRLSWEELEIAAGHPDPVGMGVILRELTRSGAATAFLGPAAFASRLSERPRGSFFARRQLEISGAVTTLAHQTVGIEDRLGRWILAHSDGARTAEELAGLLAGQVDPDLKEDPETALKEARIHVKTALEGLLNLCLFEAGS